MEAGAGVFELDDADVVTVWPSPRCTPTVVMQRTRRISRFIISFKTMDLLVESTAGTDRVRSCQPLEIPPSLAKVVLQSD